MNHGRFTRAVHQSSTSGLIGPIYHGTDSSFQEFDKARAGENHWQSRGGSKDPEDAGIFFSDRKPPQGSYRYLVEAYLKISNPRTDSAIDYWDAVEKYDRNPHVYGRDARMAGHDGAIISSLSGSLYVVFSADQVKRMKTQELP